MRENRESQPLPSTEGVGGRRGKAERPYAADARGQAVRLAHSTYEVGEQGGASLGGVGMEGRVGPRENTIQQTTSRTQSRNDVPHALERTSRSKKRQESKKFTALLHHVTVERLRHAYSELKRHAAPVSMVTWAKYQANLEENLRELQGRVQNGTYRAQPPDGYTSQGGWDAAAPGHRVAGRQDRPARDGAGAERHL